MDTEYDYCTLLDLYSPMIVPQMSKDIIAVSPMEITYNAELQSTFKKGKN